MSNLISEARSILTTMSAHWISLTLAVPAEIMTRPAAPGEWSAAQCLRHLLDTEAMVFPVRLRTFIDGGTAFPAFDPDTQGRDYSGLTPVQLVAEYARHRTENLALLDEMTPEMLERTALHAELGTVTLAEKLNEWIAHDLNHTLQAQQAIMQPFIYASGPWRFYFKDHDLGE